jgi:hypothetical protein
LASTKSTFSASPRFSARSRPTASIEPLMSSTVRAHAADASTMRKAMSPVPPATSSARQPGASAD